MSVILEDVKHALGVNASSDDDTFFDLDILTFINTAFAIILQNGAGNSDFIVEEYTLWSEFTDDSQLLNMVKSYVIYTVKTYFDPPANSVLKQQQKEIRDELLYRINTMCATSKENLYDG